MLSSEPSSGRRIGRLLQSSWCTPLKPLSLFLFLGFYSLESVRNISARLPEVSTMLRRFLVVAIAEFPLALPADVPDRGHVS
jgi:hypothetical protein